MPSRYEAKVVGFANANCKVCHGLGRMGYLGTIEQGMIQPCPCVVYFEADRLKAEADAKQKQSGTSGPPSPQR